MPRPASKYDSLYRQYSFLSDVPMFECGNGWFDLLSDLCKKLEALHLGPGFKVDQIKEKMGGLRFYIDTNTCPQEKKELVHQLISETERKSLKTCELCGKPGQISGLGSHFYVMTICKTCKKKAKW